MTPWRSRLVAYTLGTDTRLGLLPDALSYEASLCRNDPGALKVTYSRQATNGSILDTPLRDGLDIALEVNWAGGADGWHEPAGGRYLWVDVQDDAADKTDTVSLILPSYGWLLGKIGVNALELLETSGQDAGRRLFTPGSPGLMRLLLDEWASRHIGKLLRLAWNFTTTHDSTGAAWSKVKDAIPCDAHTPLSTIMASLASMDGGLCDWETVGRTLALYNPDSRVADLSATVRLEIGRDIMSAPSQETLADSAGWIMARGEGNVVGVYTDADTPAQIAAWETTLQVSGATTEAEALDGAAGDIEWRARDRGQYTRELLLDGGAEWLPLRDYGPGDVVSAWARRERAAMRVQQITLTRDGKGRHGGSVVLNDRLVPESLRQTRTLRALAQNAAITSGGSTISPVDTRTPKPPTALTLSDQRYLDPVGAWHSRIGAAWTATTQATNGSLQPIARYEMWGQPVVDGVDQPWRRLTAVDAPTLAASWQPFDVGQTWRFAVVALGSNGRSSGRSVPVLWTFGDDTTPPGKPAPATAAPYLGSVVVRWDGKDAAGALQPPDFAHAEVYIATSEATDPDPATLCGPIMPGGTLTVSGLDYDAVHWVRIVAVDTSGNRSTPSDDTPVTPRRAENQDFSAGTIYTIRNYAGPLDGNHTRMAPDGFSAWAPNPDHGDAIEAWGRFGDGLSFGFNPDAPLAAIYPDGLASFRQASVGELLVAGDTLAEILDPLPKGVIARTQGFSNATGITTTAVALSELRVILQPGRLYRVGVDMLPIQVSAAATRAEVKLHQTDDGSAVTTSSPAWIWRGDVITTTGVYVHQPTFTNVIDTSGWATAKEYRFLLSVARAAGTGTLSVYGADCQIVVQDLGAAVAPTTTKIRQTRIWQATAMYQNGAGSPVTEASVRALDGQWLHAIFGSSVAAAMSGATVHSAAVYVFMQSGRVGACRAVSSNAAVANPTTPSSGNLSRVGAPGSGMWIGLPDWTTAMQSVKVHGGGTGTIANTPANPVMLRIDYTK